MPREPLCRGCTHPKSWHLVNARDADAPRGECSHGCGCTAYKSGRARRTRTLLPPLEPPPGGLGPSDDLAAARVVHACRVFTRIRELALEIANIADIAAHDMREIPAAVTSAVTWGGRRRITLSFPVSSSPPAKPKAKTSSTAPREGELRRGARRMLGVLAAHNPRPLTRVQLATLTRMTVSGGTFGAYLSALKHAKLVDDDHGKLAITRAGYLRCSDVRQICEVDLVDAWGGVLRAGERKLLDELIAVYPKAFTREQLAQRCNMQESGGTFGAYVGNLRRNALALKLSSGAIQADGQTLHLEDAPAQIEAARQRLAS